MKLDYTHWDEDKSTQNEIMEQKDFDFFYYFGEPCPICKETLEWSKNGECVECGFDKP